MNPPADPADDSAAADGTAERPKPTVSRRTLDAVFGDALPDVTSDELEDGAENRDRDRERWYRDNRPPHHG